MYTIEAAISVSISGGNQRASGTMPSAAAPRVIECATVKAVTSSDQRAHPAKRDDEAEHEQQVIDAAKNVRERRA